MPGLVGFTRRGGDGELDILRTMQGMIKHQPFYVDDPLFSDAHICATRTHKAIVQKEVQPFVADDLHVWFKGEFYNQDKLFPTSGSDARRLSDPALLARLYRDDGHFSFLRRIDGIYSAVLYDGARKSIHLITDRYGFGYLYWTVQGGTLLWASEMKAFLAHPLFEPQIDRKTVNDFFGIGHPLESDTWFEGVKLVPPGTLLSWNIREEKLTNSVYWSWSDIRPISGPTDEHELAEELGRLWVNSVARRSRMGGKVGVTLSGGLDSRAILAAMPDLGYPVHAVTVGNPYCKDVRIARSVAKIKGVEHRVFDLNQHNWLDLRPRAVWWSDGHYDLRQMHGCVIIDKLRGMYDINLNGLIGDALMGGSYISKYNCDKDGEYNIINNRARRLISCHVHVIDDVFFHSRCPFMDNSLVDFLMSLPISLRVENRLYKPMLLDRYPELFSSIPWHHTGLPIDASQYKYKLKAISDKVYNKSYRVLRKLGIDVDGIRWVTGDNYHNYAYWIRQEPSRTMIDDILNNPSALYANYIDRDAVGQDWTNHKDGRSRTHRIFRYLTFEVWLQQVFTGAYRNWQGDEGGHSEQTVTGRIEISAA